MIKLFSEKEFNKAKSTDKLALKCKFCKNTFFLKKRRIQAIIKGKCTHKGFFCSNTCQRSDESPPIFVNCKNCDKKLKKIASQIKRGSNNFCSRSCSATYNNKHKTTGTRRSKLEIWLEEQLPSLYPNLLIHYNKKDAINSELDIYIPSLSLAFELNGIFHYEPIYGKTKLAQIQNNDNRKMQACLEKEIELCIIDVSGMKYFKPKNAQKYLDIITSIIDLKLPTS